MSASFTHAVGRLRELAQSPHAELYRRKYAGSEAVQRILEGGEIDARTWSEVPFLTREELQSTPYRDRLFVPEHQVGIVRLTSGTSGRGLLLMPRMNDIGKGNKARLFNDFFSEYAFKRYATFSGAQYQHGEAFKNLYGLDSIHIDPGNMHSAAAFVHAYRPDIIAGFSYAMSALYPCLDTRAINHVRGVYLFGERCTPMQWDLFHTQFPNAVIVEDYASVDAQTTIGFPCKEIIKNRQQYVHPISEYVYAEVVDPGTGEMVSEEGRSGELVVTVVRPVATPLVRYRTGDSARIVSNTCACGTPTPVLSIEGRLGMDKLRFSGGELNLAEVERVLRVIQGYLTGRDFEVHFSETRKGGRVFPRVQIHLQWSADTISASRLSGEIARELRVLEDKTYDLGVRLGEFEPLSVVQLSVRARAGKRVRIVRDDV